MASSNSEIRQKSKPDKAVARVSREATLPFGLVPELWEGSFNGKECSLHQLAPYVGKLKSGMVTAIIDEFTEYGDVILDPFSGSGVVPLQALLQHRKAIANDLSEYAYAVTLGKLAAPMSVEESLKQAERVIARVEATKMDQDLKAVPDWVAAFFHPETLRETLAAFKACKKLKLPFIQACLLGILHHVRPGFLSYPASHLTPYLREQKYPRDEFPEMYQYRDLASRLRAKVQRAYRRPPHATWTQEDYRVDRVNSMELPYMPESIDAIISSPPYFGALDYARDNRLRLWFLGVENWRELDKRLTASGAVYVPQMERCLLEMYRVLKPESYCVLVLGDVSRGGKMRETAEIISELASDVTRGGFETLRIVVDEIPDDRRSRRRTETTKYEKILVMRKVKAIRRNGRH